MKVDHCEFKDNPTSCLSPHSGAENIPQSYHRSSDHHLVAETSPNWRIPIGLYLRSSYVFRIQSKDIESDSVSNLFHYYVCLFVVLLNIKLPLYFAAVQFA